MQATEELKTGMWLLYGHVGWKLDVSARADICRTGFSLDNLVPFALALGLEVSLLLLRRLWLLLRHVPSTCCDSVSCSVSL